MCSNLVEITYTVPWKIMTDDIYIFKTWFLKLDLKIQFI